jgi:hypothetical protein
MTVFAPTVDALPVASLSDVELDAYVRRIPEILLRQTSPRAFDQFCDRIEGLLQRADLVKKR